MERERWGQSEANDAASDATSGTPNDAMSGAATGAAGQAGEGRDSRSGRERVQALDHRALLRLMHDDDPWAWIEFMARYRPMLASFARQARIPADDWDECVTDLLEDEAIRLSSGTATIPDDLRLYLRTAVRHRAARLRESRQRRQRIHELAAVPYGGEWVVAASVSEGSRAASGIAAPPAGSEAFAILAELVRRDLTDDEQRLLAWVAERVPYRQIAAWLGISYHAAAKRVARLCRKARLRGARYARSLPLDDRERLAPLLGLDVHDPPGAEGGRAERPGDGHDG